MQSGPEQTIAKYERKYLMILRYQKDQDKNGKRNKQRALKQETSPPAMIKLDKGT